MASNRAAGPLLTWRPAGRHRETKEHLNMRSVPSPRPNLQGVKHDRTGIFEEIGTVPVVNTVLAGEHLDGKTATLTVESIQGFPNSGTLLIAGNHSMAESEIVHYTGRTETGFLQCRRGEENTRPAMHWSGVRI